LDRLPLFLLGCALSLLTAVGDTTATSREIPPPEPTAIYASLDAVRDTVETILRRAVSPADTAIHISREAVNFKYLYAPATASGWAFHIEVNDTSGCPQAYLERALLASGWAPHYGYQADGPDGGNMGFVSKNYLCVYEAEWDGGDDSDSTYVPAPGCKVTVTCVPRRADDVSRP
jgi:hypothetical protein